MNIENVERRAKGEERTVEAENGNNEKIDKINNLISPCVSGDVIFDNRKVVREATKVLCKLPFKMPKL